MARKVDKSHPLYNRRLPGWVRQRDVVEGEDAIKAAGPAYLPRLKEQDPQEYDAYKGRAQFLNATGRTVESLVGLVLRKPATLQWPKAEGGALKVVGISGRSLPAVTQVTLIELLGIGRYGILVDAPEAGGEPYVSEYVAEAITDWEKAVVEDRVATTRVVLKEEEARTTEDGTDYTWTTYRVLRLWPTQRVMPESDAELEAANQGGMEAFLRLYGLTPDAFGPDPTYFVEVHAKLDQDAQGLPSGEYQRVSIVVPQTRGGSRLPRIPFTFFNPTSTDPDPEAPPLMDLALLNLSHYRNSADLEHGLHFTALPQPYVTGSHLPAKLLIGSESAWGLPDPNSTVGYLEFSGQGLAALRETMKEKKQEMAMLGARLLEAPQAPAESGTALRLRQSGERSALATLAIAASGGLTRVLQDLALWKGISEDVGIALNLDFDVTVIDPNLLAQLMAAVQGGTMSWSTYFWNMQRHELIPEGRTEEEEAELIQVGPPVGVESGGEPGTPTEGEVVHLSVVDGHSHTWRRGDPETSENDGHRHGVREEGGKVTVLEVDGHTHEVVGEEPKEPEEGGEG